MFCPVKDCFMMLALFWNNNKSNLNNLKQSYWCDNLICLKPNVSKNGFFFFTILFNYYCQLIFKKSFNLPHSEVFHLIYQILFEICWWRKIWWICKKLSVNYGKINGLVATQWSIFKNLIRKLTRLQNLWQFLVILA